MTHHNICDECETVSHCSKNGCIPKTPARTIEELHALMREVLAEQPAPVQQVPDKHQEYIDSLSHDHDSEEKMLTQIYHWARQSYSRHQQLVSGQMITAADSSDNHIIWAALRWAKENPFPQAQPAPAAQPVPDAVIAGAMFDFMGWLTSRKERIVLSSVDDAAPAVEAITTFAKMRGLSLDDAKVQDWQNKIKE